jgi:serine/threonine protein kinase
MELVELGSLSYLLHYCDNPAVEAKMTDGRIKKKILYGITCGMYQLHFSRIVHGDLKPQNVLVSDDYEAKITDFGLSTFRGKSTSALASSKFDDFDGEIGMVGGTAGYMAPELLDSCSPPKFSSDVYSFGVTMNELISEEEPYADQFANFAGRGPFGAVNYAKQGHRPTMRRGMPGTVKELITRCWSDVPKSRPDFEEIMHTIEQSTFVIPDTI